MSKKWNVEMSRNNKERFEATEYVANYQAYRALALAVCEQAVIDYKDMCERGRERGNADSRDTIEFFEKFFLSDAFDLLSCDVVDGSQIISAVKANSRKTNKKLTRIADALPDAVDDGGTPIDVVVERIGFKPLSIRNFVSHHKEYKLKNGVIYKEVMQ